VKIAQLNPVHFKSTVTNKAIQLKTHLSSPQLHSLCPVTHIFSQQKIVECIRTYEVEELTENMPETDSK